jgi:hypothetical protein
VTSSSVENVWLGALLNSVSIACSMPPVAETSEPRWPRRNLHQHARCALLYARMPVMTRGFVGRGATLEVQCLDCAGPNLSYTLNQHEPAHCAFCGRGVYDRWRRHRRRSFCCETCRRKWKARSAPVSGAVRRAEASRVALDARTANTHGRGPAAPLNGLPGARYGGQGRGRYQPWDTTWRRPSRSKNRNAV